MRISKSVRTTRRVIATALALAVLLAACSSGSDSVPLSDVAVTAEDSASDAEENGAEAATQPASNTEFDCEKLPEHAGVIRAANLWLPQVPAVGRYDTLGEDLDNVEAAIEGLRPIQDIEGLVFGTPREGLDNLAADVQALREETFTERSGTYGSVAISSIIADICF